MSLLLESTYGDRVHPDADDATALPQLIEETAARGGRVIVPAFAVGRAEEVLYWIKRLEDSGRLTPLPVYLDSPMAVEALRVLREARRGARSGDVRGGNGEVTAFSPRRFRAISSARESKEVVASHGPAIVIAASGMATGGRVLHHLTAMPARRPQYRAVCRVPGTGHARRECWSMARMR